MSHINDFQNKIQKIRDDAIFNIGESGKATASEIIRIINETSISKIACDKFVLTLYYG